MYIECVVDALDHKNVRIFLIAGLIRKTAVVYFLLAHPAWVGAPSPSISRIQRCYLKRNGRGATIDWKIKNYRRFESEYDVGDKLESDPCTFDNGTTLSLVLYPKGNCCSSPPPKKGGGNRKTKYLSIYLKLKSRRENTKTLVDEGVGVRPLFMIVKRTGGKGCDSSMFF